MASNLYLDEKMSDLVLKVPHGGYSWRFPVHSLVLNSRSETLQEIIENHRAENSIQQNSRTAVTIIGMRPDTILALLRFIYSNEYPADVTADLLVAAEKYKLRDLRNYLEERLITNLRVEQACKILEEYELEQATEADDAVKEACLELLEQHACRVFSSNLVLGLSKGVLVKLLESDKLNVPDEAIIFWGLWRWGRKESCRKNKSLDVKSLVEFLDELLVLVRLDSVRQKNGIPAAAMCRFQKSPKTRRCQYMVPKDSLAQSESLRTCDAWDGFAENPGKQPLLCFQVSFDRKVLLVGITMEVLASEKFKSVVRLIRELDVRELIRQEIDFCRCKTRKTSPNSEPDSWIEADVVFREPVVLSGHEIFSLYLQVCPGHFPSGSCQSHRKRVGNISAILHGDNVVGVRDLYVMPAGCYS